MAAASDTIDHTTLSRLVEAGAVRGAHIVGQHGGWAVLVKYGMHERPLAAQRTRQVRLFRRFETLVTYLKGVGLARFDVDASGYDLEGSATVRRPDRSEVLKQAHAAAAHDKWFREQVAQGLKEAADPATVRLSNEEVKAESAKRRAGWGKQADGAGRRRGGVA